MMLGELAYHKGDHTEVFEHLRKSVETDDTLPYDELLAKIRAMTNYRVVADEASENGYKLEPDILRQAVTDRTKMFCITSPSNPSGVTYFPDEIRALADVLIDHELLVLSDEIYDRLVFDGQKTMSFAAAGDRAEDPGPNHFALGRLTVEAQHVCAVADHASLLGHLPLELEPQATEIFGRRKLLGAAEAIQ